MSLSGCSIVWEMQVPSISPSIFQILLRWMRKGIEVFIVHTWIQLCTKSEVSTWCMELGYLSAFSLEWEDECVVRLNWKKKRSLCSQGVPSETSEMDERIALAKSYTGRSIYTHISCSWVWCEQHTQNKVCRKHALRGSSSLLNLNDVWDESVHKLHFFQLFPVY